jgi:hypothetical protein
MFQFCCLCCFPGPSNEKSSLNNYSEENAKKYQRNAEGDVIGMGPGENIEMIDNPGFYDASEELPVEGAGALHDGMVAVPAEGYTR